MPDAALEGIRVLELGQMISAPYCAKLFADYGADVIKIETPEDGDISRNWGPFPNDQAHPEKSGLFHFLNTNKRGVTLDVRTESGREQTLGLVERADLLIENNSPRQMRGWGLDYATLSKLNPNLVMISITPFGQTGAYADWNGYDLNAYHLSGASSRHCGHPGEPPLEHGRWEIMEQCQANGCPVTALFDVEEAAEHPHLQERGYIIELEHPVLGRFRDLGAPFKLPESPGGPSVAAPQLGEHNAEVFGDLLETSAEDITRIRAEGITAEALPLQGIRVANFGWVWAGPVVGQTLGFLGAEVYKIESRARVDLTRSLPPFAEGVRDPHYRARGTFVEVRHPLGFQETIYGAYVKTSRTRPAVSPGPCIGRDNDHVFRELLGIPEERYRQLIETQVIY